MRKLGGRLLLAGAMTSLFGGSASAQQTLNLSVGVFTPRGEDARVEGDVLNENRTFLTFDLKDFNGAAVGGEWLAGIGKYFELGGGMGFYRRTVPSVYTNFTHRDRSEIEQELRLRIVPLAATVRILPLGQHAGVQPYFGAGIGLFNWRYAEVGEFIDFGTPTRETFRDQYVATGNAAGPLALAGVRFAGDTFAAGGEVRYSKAEGTLDERFAAGKLDLGGWAYQFNVGLRFR